MLIITVGSSRKKKKKNFEGFFIFPSLEQGHTMPHLRGPMGSQWHHHHTQGCCASQCAHSLAWAVFCCSKTKKNFEPTRFRSPGHEMPPTPGLGGPSGITPCHSCCRCGQGKWAKKCGRGFSRLSCFGICRTFGESHSIYMKERSGQ